MIESWFSKSTSDFSHALSVTRNNFIILDTLDIDKKTDFILLEIKTHFMQRESRWRNGRHALWQFGGYEFLVQSIDKGLTPRLKQPLKVVNLRCGGPAKNQQVYHLHM